MSQNLFHQLKKPYFIQDFLKKFRQTAYRRSIPPNPQQATPLATLAGTPEGGGRNVA